MNRCSDFECGHCDGSSNDSQKRFSAHVMFSPVLFDDDNWHQIRMELMNDVIGIAERILAKKGLEIHDQINFQFGKYVDLVNADGFEWRGAGDAWVVVVEVNTREKE